MNKIQLQKIIAKFDKVASPYPPGDYPYTQTEITGDEVYHAVTRIETVIDIITNGVLRPIAGTESTSSGMEIASGRAGFVSLTSRRNQPMGTFGDYMFFFDWSCLQSKNMGLLPIRYINMVRVPRMLGWEDNFDSDDKLKLVYPDFVEDSYSFPNDDELNIILNGEFATASDLFFRLYKFALPDAWESEQEMRSYSHVFVAGCIKHIEFIGQGNYEVDDRVNGGYVKTDDAPKRQSGEHISNGDRWTPEEFLAEFGSIKTAGTPEEEILYHGSSGNIIRKICNEGYVQVPDYSDERELDVTPLNRVYLTNDLGYALIYALGADMVGKDISNWGMDEREGGIVIVRPEGNCIMDEDWIGELVCDWYSRNESGNSRYSNYEWKHEVSEDTIGDLYERLPDDIIYMLQTVGEPRERDQEDIDYMLENYPDAEDDEIYFIYEDFWCYDVWCRIGKAIIRIHLTYPDYIGSVIWNNLLSYATSYSCDEKLKVISGWVFDRAIDNLKLKKDGSNFFEIATKIYP